MRQAGILKQFDPKPGVSVATLAYEYPAGFEVPEHAHGSDQLIYAISGVMEVFSGENMWLTPPRFALWIPAKTAHRIHMPGAVSMRTLYFRPGLVFQSGSVHFEPGLVRSRSSPAQTPHLRSAVLHVTPLLRELVLETVRIGNLRAADRHERALRDLLILHLETASPVPTFVALPRDQRAWTVAQAVLSAPGQARPLAELCSEAGASVRTIQRIFRREVGSDFESWRRQARLTKAVELLVAGRSVKEVAYSVGYRQSSAFVESFRGTFGMTPKAWTVWLEKLNQGSQVR
jgi:AraC-like DNA-binding protein/quercetin dioxygenase-like cupin family protein